MSQEDQAPSGRSQTLDIFILNSLQAIHQSLGGLQGEVRSFRDEMVGRVTRIEDRERAASGTSILVAVLKLLLSRHVVILAPTFILALFGLLSPAEMKAILFGVAGVKVP